MKALSANRIILILGIIITVAGAAATYVAGVTNSLPTSWQGDAAIIVTILGGIAGVTASVLKFLDGSQKSEALQLQAASRSDTPVMTLNEAREKLNFPPTTRTSLPLGGTIVPAPEPEPEAPEVDESTFAPRPEGQTDDKGWRPTSAMAAQAQPNELYVAPKEANQA